MEVDEKPHKGEGFRPYYVTKIEELQLIVAEKSQNLRRLQAQRNELNAKVRMLREELQLLQVRLFFLHCRSLILKVLGLSYLLNLFF